MTAKYLRLATILREQIRSNINASGRKLPTEAVLSKRYGVSRQTVREALKLLKSEGLIETRQGSGTYVVEKTDRDASNKIAVLISSDSEYIYPELISDIKAVFKKNGYVTNVFTTRNSISLERELLQKISAENYAGLIAEPVKNAYPGASPDLYEKIKSKGTQIVFMRGGYYNFPDYPYVKSDDVYGGYLSCRMLLKKNHGNIVCLLNRDCMSGIERYQGILMAINDSDIAVSDDNCTWYSSENVKNLREKQDHSFLIDFINKNISRSSAVICMDDEIAYWLIKELRSRGTDVPGDISVVSFDNSYLSTFDKPLITSMSHNAHELGRSSAQALLKLINGQPFSSQKLSWHPVNRDSDSVYDRKLD